MAATGYELYPVDLCIIAAALTAAFLFRKYPISSELYKLLS